MRAVFVELPAFERHRRDYLRGMIKAELRARSVK
jgi:hypothetical protein